MERLIGMCALAFSMSVFAQQGQPPSEQEQAYDTQTQTQQQRQLGEADAQDVYQERDVERQPQTDVQRTGDDTQRSEHDDMQRAGDDVKRADQQAEQRSGQQQSTPGGQSQSLQSLADEHDDLSTFVRAMQETGLADAVARGEYTAFAPTNEAFDATGKSVDELLRPENQEQLIELLRNHLIAEQVDAERAKQLDQALTVGGATLDLSASEGELTVNGAEVTETDIRSEGLIVHTIEKVLEPAEDSGAQQSAAGEQRGTESVAEQDESEEYEDQSEE